LLVIGKPASDPIGLKVWAESLPRGADKQKEPRRIGFRADRNAYVTVVAVSGAGDVAVMIPKGKSPDTEIKKGERYTLAATVVMTGLGLAKGTLEGKLAFYVSSKPFDLGPFKPSPEKGWITIPADASGKMKNLAEKLENATADKGFNRVMFDMKRLAAGPRSLRLMGFPKSVPAAKRAAPPSPVDSEIPGQVTGAQGRTKKIRPEE